VIQKEADRAVGVLLRAHAVRDADHPVLLACRTAGARHLVGHAEKRQDIELAVRRAAIRRYVRAHACNESLPEGRDAGEMERGTRGGAPEEDFR
jgi:hypothetical protein